MNDQPTILLCPGQGAQHVGMGRAWADRHPIAARTFAEADDLLDFSLSRLCFEGPEDQLNRTDHAQAAIYVTSVACCRALGWAAEMELLPGTLPGALPGVGLLPGGATAGLSLGEFTALHLAGAFSFADGLKLVRLRGQAMQQAAEASQSTMVAVTGDVTEAKINELCDAARGDGILVPANFNSPMQVVVSGSLEACRRALLLAEHMGFRGTPLTVAGAFHSPIMQPAADQLAAALEQVDWKLPGVPVLSNVTGQPHERDLASIKQRLVEQLTHPVRWSQSMQWAAKNLPGRYVELAPGKVLSGLMRRIDKTIKVENHAEPS